MSEQEEREKYNEDRQIHDEEAARDCFESERSCTECRWFIRFADALSHDKSPMGCQERNWSGYVTDPDKPPCGGVAFVGDKHTPDKCIGKYYDGKCLCMYCGRELHPANGNNQ